MDESDIICRFLDAELCLHPNVLEQISSMEDPSEVVERLISSTEGNGRIITPEDVRALKTEVIVKKGRRRIAEEYDSEIELRDVSKNASSRGCIEGFVEHFNSRYEKGLKVFRERKHLIDSHTVEQALAAGGKSDVKIIGLVESVRESKKGNTIIFIEDPTGVVPVVVLKSDRELAEFARTIVNDDILAVEGVTGSREGGIVIAKTLSFPDVPYQRATESRSEPLAIALVSDIHVGSFEFMEKEFLRFLKWLNCEVGSSRQRELAERVKYMVVAGDLVDGVGIYPGQIDDLNIKDIFSQYKRLSELFDMIPDYIEIIVGPGNHDATRQAEPQTPIFEDYAPELYENPMIHMVGNPCYARLHGTSVLAYHGRSMDDIISKVPGNSYSEPDKAMLNLLKKRQLVPIFGEKVPVSPGTEDCLFIDEVPDILHCGHVHTTGVQSYRGVTIVNSGAFQSQTDFQKRLNMQPDPGKVPIYEISTRKTTIMKFT